MTTYYSSSTRWFKYIPTSSAYSKPMGRWLKGGGGSGCREKRKFSHTLETQIQEFRARTRQTSQYIIRRYTHIILCSSVVSDGITVITTIKIDGCNDSRILSTRTTTVSNKNIISLYYTQVYRIKTTRERNPRLGRRCCCPAKRKTSRFRARRVHVSLLSP